MKLSDLEFKVMDAIKAVPHDLNEVADKCSLLYHDALKVISGLHSKGMIEATKYGFHPTTIGRAAHVGYITSTMWGTQAL